MIYVTVHGFRVQRFRVERFNVERRTQNGEPWCLSGRIEKVLPKKCIKFANKRLNESIIWQYWKY